MARQDIIEKIQEQILTSAYELAKDGDEFSIRLVLDNLSKFEQLNNNETMGMKDLKQLQALISGIDPTDQVKSTELVFKPIKD